MILNRARWMFTEIRTWGRVSKAWTSSTYLGSDTVWQKSGVSSAHEAHYVLWEFSSDRLRHWEIPKKWERMQWYSFINTKIPDTGTVSSPKQSISWTLDIKRGTHNTIYIIYSSHTYLFFFISNLHISDLLSQHTGRRQGVSDNT